jgi:hypothetical protein
MDGQPCGSETSTTSVSAAVSVTDDGPAGNLEVTLYWSGGFDNGSRGMSPGGGGSWSASVGPFSYPGSPNDGGTLDVWVTVSDGTHTVTVNGASVTVAACQPAPPPG